MIVLPLRFLFGVRDFSSHRFFTPHIHLLQIVCVLGATGLQGGSVVSSLLKDDGFKVRVLTRDDTKEAAKKLAAAGVEVMLFLHGSARVLTASFVLTMVVMRMIDKSLFPSQVVKGDYTKDISTFFQGAYAAFVVTNFWDPATGTSEEAFGRSLVDAAHKAGVKHFMYHTLPHAAVISEGKVHTFL